MVWAEKNQFKKGENVLFTLFGEPVSCPDHRKNQFLNTQSNRTFFAALQDSPR
jgi:hypothetical protein